MSVRKIIEAFDAWRVQDAPLVLATVYRTAGSTYSKPGHRILINADGDYRGLVSGGCLEGDLAEHASRVVATGVPAAVTYDLRDGADELFGLGVGCNGLIAVYLQPLTARDGYEPYATMAARELDGKATAAATVIAVEGGLARAQDDGLAAGATVVVGASAHTAVGVGEAAAARLALRCRAAVEDGAARFVEEEGSSVLYAPLERVPRMLVLGAGLDAQPLVRMAVELGWRVTVADHRPAYVERGGFATAEKTELVDPDELAVKFALDEYDAVIVMSHHLVTDRRYLAQLAACGAGYLGVLGPRARRDRLLDELGERGARLRERLEGPVGLDIGADSPESIALSILADLQQRVSTTRRAARRRTS
jgi:xanthine/CO dehydrogenase XdhC/CoxF family maturation factor